MSLDQDISIHTSLRLWILTGGYANSRYAFKNRIIQPTGFYMQHDFTYEIFFGKRGTSDFVCN